MTAPDAYVEVAFGSTWQTEPADMVWTNLTGRVLHSNGVSTSRGSSAARGQVDAGELHLSFLNSDRKLDPTYEDGDYFGSLLPGTPIRLLAAIGGDRLLWDGESLTWQTEELLWGAAIVPVWYGTVAKWPQRYDIGNTFGWVPVEAWDGFDKLSRAKIPRSVLEVEVLADDPVGYWPLDEVSGAVFSDRAGHSDATTTSVPEFATLETQDGRHAIPVAVLDGVSIDAHEIELTKVSRGLTLEALARWDGDTGSSSSGAVVTMGTGTAGDEVFLVIDATAGDTGLAGGIASVGGLSGNVFAHAFGEDVIPGITSFVHHLAYRCPTAGDAAVYVNGVDVTVLTLTEGSPTTAHPPGVTIGDLDNPASAYEWYGPLASVAVFHSDIGASRIAAHSAAAFAPLDGQTIDERIDWILDELGWPTNLRNLETGQTILGPATFKPGDGALEYLRLLNASEDGLMFIEPDGTVRFLDRYWRFLDTRATISQFTFTDQDGDRGYAEFDLDLDDELLVNVARFTRRDGTEQVATDPASIAVYGEAELQQSNLLVQTDNEALSLAEWTVATRSTPLPRVPKIRIPLHSYSEADQATVLGLDLGHRVTCERTPQGIGNEIVLDFVIDGIRNEVGKGEWWWEAFVSPAPDTTLTPFRWDVSEWDGDHAWAH